MSSRRGFLGTMIGSAAGAAMAGAATTATAASKARVLGANDRVRFGLIGAGDRGQAILKAAINCPNTELVAIADAFTGRFDEVKKFAPDVATFQDYRELLDDKSIDAVLIATPQHLHALHFVDAIEAGKDVYQEKTMAFTPNHARRMRQALKGSDRVVQIGLQHNSHSTTREVRDLVRSGDLGTITLVETRLFRAAPYGGWLREIPSNCDPKHVDWKAFQGEAKEVAFDPDRFINWRFYWDYSGGNVFENMVHIAAFWFATLDLSIPQSVTSTGSNYLSPKMNVPDTFQVSMSHAEKLLFTFTSVFGNGHPGEGHGLLYGTKGTLVQSLSGPVRFIPADPKAKAESPKPAPQNTTAIHMQNFFECVRSRSEPNSPFELGFRTAIACRMAVESFRRGTTVQWDPATEEII